MINNNNYQYNSCSSRGACSTNPKISSLQEILVLYLKYAAYYAMYLEENGCHNDKIKNLILNTISVMVSNPEFSETDFLSITSSFKRELPVLIKEYKTQCNQKDVKPKYQKSPITQNSKNSDIVSSIRLGEKEFLKKIKTVPSNIINLYTISFIIAKSVCINIISLQTYGRDECDGYIKVLKLLNLINDEEKDINVIKDFIIEISKIDNDLMEKIRTIQEEMYGLQRPKTVSFSTEKGKAILVAGENIRELEMLLDSIKDTNIDVYTHDKMILAHTFPKFSEYKNLKGHYGQGIDNYLPDFATFPGPIFLTKHSLYNVENLYRGQLFTTDLANTKGVIQIRDTDFSKLIESAKNSRGFKSGKICDDDNIGYDFEHIKSEIRGKLGGKREGKYTKIFVLGNNNYSPELSEYFNTIIKKSTDETLLISLAPRDGREDMISFNACFDVCAITKVIKYIRTLTKIPIAVFMPECKRHTIPMLINLKTVYDTDIFAGKCNPMYFNPTLMATLENIFGIHSITDADNDLKKIKE